jgi:hypothetical protein
MVVWNLPFGDHYTYREYYHFFLNNDTIKLE